MSMQFLFFHFIQFLFNFPGAAAEHRLGTSALTSLDVNTAFHTNIKNYFDTVHVLHRCTKSFFPCSCVSIG